METLSNTMVFESFAQLRRAAAGLEGSAAHPANRGTKPKMPSHLRGARAQAKGLHLGDPEVESCGQMQSKLRKTH